MAWRFWINEAQRSNKAGKGPVPSGGIVTLSEKNRHLHQEPGGQAVLPAAGAQPFHPALVEDRIERRNAKDRKKIAYLI